MEFKYKIIVKISTSLSVIHTLNDKADNLNSMIKIVESRMIEFSNINIKAISVTAEILTGRE